MTKKILPISGVYAITNTVNGKRYIGSSSHIKKRWQEHVKGFRNQKRTSLKLQNAVTKHRESSFRFDILVVCSKEHLLMYEQILIDGFDTVDTGYNTRLIAESNRGITPSHETRERMSLAAKARPRSTYSAEHCKAISDAKMGRKTGPVTESARKNMSIARRGNRNAANTVYTPEMRAARSAQMLGKKRGPYKTKAMASTDNG